MEIGIREREIIYFQQNLLSSQQCWENDNPLSFVLSLSILSCIVLKIPSQKKLCRVFFIKCKKRFLIFIENEAKYELTEKEVKDESAQLNAFVYHLKANFYLRCRGTINLELYIPKRCAKNNNKTSSSKERVMHQKSLFIYGNKMWPK